jgi:hypothetical protein
MKCSPWFGDSNELPCMLFECADATLAPIPFWNSRIIFLGGMEQRNRGSIVVIHADWAAWPCQKAYEILHFLKSICRNTKTMELCSFSSQCPHSGLYFYLCPIFRLNVAACRFIVGPFVPSCLFIDDSIKTEDTLRVQKSQHEVAMTSILDYCRLVWPHWKFVMNSVTKMRPLEAERSNNEANVVITL